MKRVMTGIVATMFVIILLTPSCKTFVWDPSGAWNLTVTCSHSVTWIEPLTFTGSDESGTVYGLRLDNSYPPLTGTYTKTGDFTVNLSFPLDGAGWTCTMTLNSSEDSPNTGTGTGVWQEGAWSDPLNFTATKTGNLQ